MRSVIPDSAGYQPEYRNTIYNNYGSRVLPPDSTANYQRSIYYLDKAGKLPAVQRSENYYPCALWHSVKLHEPAALQRKHAFIAMRP